MDNAPGNPVAFEIVLIWHSACKTRFQRLTGTVFFVGDHHDIVW